MSAERVQRHTLAAFGAAAGLLVLVSVVAVCAVRGYERSSGWVRHTYEVIAEFESMQGALSATEAAALGFLATAEPSYLEARAEALSRLESHVQTVKLLTMDNGAQQRRMRQLESTLARRSAQIDDLIVMTQTQGLTAARRSLGMHNASLATQEANARIGEMRRVEQALLEARRLADARYLRLLWGAFTLLLPTILGVLGWMLARIRRDIAQRAQQSDDLRRANTFLESIFENLPLMIFIKDAQQLRFVRLNRAGEALLGVQRGDLIGRNDHEMFPAAQANAFIAKDRQVLANPNAVEVVEEPLNSRALGLRWLQTRKVAIGSQDGRPEFLLGISEDITEKKAAAEHIRALNADLALQAAQLTRANAGLEAANQELESFSYSVSHDLRSPLRAIDGFALMLEEDYGPGLDDTARRYIKVVREGSQRMAALIDDLLAFSRLGRQSLQRVPIDMNTLVNQVIAETLQAHPSQDIAVSVEQLPAAAGDPALLRQVWSNLISNAVKYSAKATTPQIRVRGARDGGVVRYEVLDNGVGFDMQYVNKLFGVFQRLHAHNEYPGTGVGLAIVHRIISRHAGRVSAWGELGKGATFAFTLPLAEES